MADNSKQTPKSNESQLPAPKLLRKEEWYYPPSGSYSPKRYYLCEYCEYKSTNSLRFKSHVEKFHSETRIKLSPVKSTTTNRVAFKTSGSKRSKKRRLKLTSSLNAICNSNHHRLVGCNLCGFRTTLMKNLRIHLSNHKKKKAFQCSKCSYSASNMARITFHINRDHWNESETIPEMDLNMIPIKENNVQVEKVEEISPRKVKKADRMLYCDFCDYSTVITTNMRCHTIRHQKNERFKCHMCNYSAGLKHNIEKHIRHHHLSNEVSHQTCEVELNSISVEPEMPEILLEELAVSHSDGSSSAESEILAESEFELWKKSTTNRERICNAGQETSIFLCPNCSYWNRGILGFHDHMLTHRFDPAYRCSGCDYANRFRSKVNFHIREEKKTKGNTHSYARTIMIHPVPADKYAGYRQAAVIEKGLSYGWTTMMPNTTKEMNAEKGPSQSSSFLSDKSASSECKDLDDITNDLEQRLHDFDSASLTNPPAKKRMRSESNTYSKEIRFDCLEAEEVDLRKQIVRARKAIFDSLSNVTNNKKSAPRVRSAKEKGHLEKMRLRIDSMRMKVKSTEEEVESLSSMKSDIRKKINEVTGAKMKAEYDLRSHQCEVLSLQLAVHETMALGEVEKSLADAEEEVKCAENEVDQKKAELESFRKEYDILRERREQAEEALAGASQVLQFLEGELKVVESGKYGDSFSGCSKTQERIKDCVKLEKRLLKITYLKSLAKVCQLEKKWLDSIHRYEEQETVVPSKSSVE